MKQGLGLYFGILLRLGQPLGGDTDRPEVKPEVVAVLLESVLVLAHSIMNGAVPPRSCETLEPEVAITVLHIGAGMSIAAVGDVTDSAFVFAPQWP